jgi:hypothetical protein
MILTGLIIIIAVIMMLTVRRIRRKPSDMAPAEAIAMPPVQAPEINGSEVTAEMEQAGRP